MYEIIAGSTAQATPKENARRTETRLLLTMAAHKVVLRNAIFAVECRITYLYKAARTTAIKLK